MKVYEIFFLLSGLGILFSLSFIEGSGIWLWLLAKVFYFTGLLFFIFKIFNR